MECNNHQNYMVTQKEESCLCQGLNQHPRCTDVECGELVFSGQDGGGVQV